MKLIINKIIILALIIASIFLLNHYFLKYDFVSLFNALITPFNSPSSQDSVEPIKPQIRLTVTYPRQYQVINISEPLKLELSDPYIDGDLDVLLLSLDDNQTDKPVQQTYDLGNRKFNKGFVEFNTKDYPAGQYKFTLSNNEQVVAESFVFTLSSETQKLDFINPLSNQLLQKSNKVISWTSTPDIYFLNVYLENDFERFTLAQNLVNTGNFDWNLTDIFDRSIDDGEYVLLIEDNFTKLILNKVRFKIKK